MAGLIRIALLAVAALTVIYACAYLYWREGRRERLAEEWVMAGRPGTREAFVADRIAPDAARVQRRLALWIYALPLGALVALIALTE